MVPQDQALKTQTDSLGCRKFCCFISVFQLILGLASTSVGAYYSWQASGNLSGLMTAAIFSARRG